VEDGATVGQGARVLPGAVIGKNAFVDAGAVVPANAKVPAGEVGRVLTVSCTVRYAAVTL
jgi:carbonic anhydrase/acetyltransferase-like protein (isoleucine patch superfamily)